MQGSLDVGHVPGIIAVFIDGVVHEEVGRHANRDKNLRWQDELDVGRRLELAAEYPPVMDGVGDDEYGGMRVLCGDLTRLLHHAGGAPGLAEGGMGGCAHGGDGEHKGTEETKGVGGSGLPARGDGVAERDHLSGMVVHHLLDAYFSQFAVAVDFGAEA